jgi:predicted TIM-barrel fold metal-dependent hydrolase
MARHEFTDTHVHFHDLDVRPLRYEWLEPGAAEDEDLGDYGAIRAEHYRAADYLAETRFHSVGRVVHVQAAVGTPDPVDETRWLQRASDDLGIPHGIVAGADLSAPDRDDVLRRHLEFPALRGIRDLRYDDYLTDERWAEGFARLGELGLVCCDDPVIEQYGAAAALAARHPQTTLCVDHAGFPRRRDDAYFAEWREGMRAIAAVPSTVVKVSGLGMCDHRWTVDSLRPWVLTCIELFGVDRAFFGTNWPVDRLFSSYGDVVDAYAEIIADFSDDEQRALFSGNANRVFRL